VVASDPLRAATVRRKAEPSSSHASPEAASGPELAGGASHDAISALQHSVGNRAVSRLVESSADGGAGIAQAVASGRLSLGRDDDPAERHADRFADAAAKGERAPVPPRSDPTKVARRAAGASRGRPLPASSRRSLEGSAGRSLAQVRVHDDRAAASDAAALSAHAFTVGNDIYFGAGQLAPGTPSGDHLIAHEVGHVLAADAGTVRPLSFGRKSKSKDQDKGKAKAAARQGFTFEAGTLRSKVSAFELSDGNTQMAKDAKRRTLAENLALTVAQEGGKPVAVTDAKGKPTDYVVCRLGSDLLAVPKAGLEAPSSKHAKRGAAAVKITDKVSEFANDRVDQMSSGMALGSLTDARQQAAGIPAITDPGERETAEQGVYDSANWYVNEYEIGAGTLGAGTDLFTQARDWTQMIRSWKSKSGPERAEMLGNNAAGLAKAFASFSNFVAQVDIKVRNPDTEGVNAGMRSVRVSDGQGGLKWASEKYGGTNIEAVSIPAGLFASAGDALMGLKDMIKDVVNWAKHISEPDKHGNLVRETVNAVQSFGKAVKGALSVAFKVLDYFQGTAGGAAASFAPGIGLALNAVELLKRGLDIYRAKKDAKDVKAGKASAKSELKQVWGEVKDLDHRKIAAKKLVLQQQLEQANLSDEEKAKISHQLEVIEQYELDAHLAGTADKRRNRAILHIVKVGQSLIGEILNLAGQAHAGMALKLSSTATGLGAIGLRKFKQFGRDHEWWKSSKTTSAKNERYSKVAEQLYDETAAIITQSQPIFARRSIAAPATALDWEKALNRLVNEPDEGKAVGPLLERHIRLKGRVKAAGCSWREYQAQADPGKKFAMLIEAQKRRE
jgi:hypothetical protein